MQKRTLTSLLLASALPLSAHALGLGNIEVYSALNQPLDAEIEITAAKPGETENLIVQLASEKAFTRAGVQRPYLLNNLDFESTMREDGTPVVKVTTKKPVREPFLNFLVDVEWPRGHLVREFTLLLDPPNFALQQPKQASSAPETSRPSEPSTAGSAPIEREPEPAPAPEPAPEPQAAPEPTPEPAPEPKQASQSEVVAAPVAADESDADDSQQAEATAPEDETVQPAELPPESTGEEDSPFADLLNDLEGDQEAAFDDSGYAATAQPETTESAESESLPYDDTAGDVDVSGLDGESLPAIDVELDPTKPFNAEAIVADDEAYIGPDIEQLFKAKQERLYSQPEPRMAEPEPMPEPEPEPERPSEYAVQQGDIMLEVAEQFRPQGVDINQAMLAIMRANPEAFIQDNVNLVREGQVLRIPDTESMQSMPTGEALNEVLAQNALWREYKAQVAGTQTASREAEADAETDAPAESADAAETAADSEQTGDGTQLSLVAPDEGESGTNYNAAGEEGEAGSEGRLRRDLSLARESLEASNLEKDEIESRISELEDIVTRSEGLIELKSEKMAQAQEGAEQANQAAAEYESGEAESDESAAAEEGGEEAETAAEDQAQEPTSARPTGIGGVIYDLLPEGLRPTMQPLLSGPLVWVIIALPVIILLGLLFALRQRGGKSDDALENIVFDDDDDQSGEGQSAEKTGGDEDTEATQTQVGDGDFDSDATMVVSPEEREAAMQSGEAEQSVSDESEDDEEVQNTLAEADVYIAYGLFDQSEDLLKQTIEDNPDVPAYRGKLLESHFNAGKKDEFVATAEALKEKVDPETSRVWQKAVVMGQEIAPESPLFAGAEVSGDLQASDFSQDRPDTPDVDLGGDADIDLSSADISDDEGESAESGQDNVELEDDFSLGDVVAELDDNDDSAPSASVEEEEDEIDFDVDNFLSDTGADDEEAQAPAEDDDSDEPIADISLDLGDEEENADKGESAEAASDDSADDDFGDLGDFDLDDDSGEDKGETSGESDSDSLDFDLGDSEDEVSAGDSVAMDFDLDDDSPEQDKEDEASGDDGFDLDMGALDDSDEGTASDTPEETPSGDEASDDFAFDLDDFGTEEKDDSSDSGEVDLGSDDSGDDGFDLDFDTGDDDEEDDAASETSMLDDDDLDTMIDDIGEEGEIPEGEDMPDNLDEVGTKLDLAKAYIDMGDTEGAKSSLEEVIEEGSDEQKKAAEELLSQI
ncbi:MAG: FimV/HubP family polar landmark protein [Pseudomonadota bacterium]